MLHVSLRLDNRYFNLGLETDMVSVFLDTAAYSYFALTDDFKSISVTYMPPMGDNSNSKLNIAVEPNVTIYRIPNDSMGGSAFWCTDKSIPVDKLEFFETSQNYYGKYCAMWVPTMRPEVPKDVKINDLYSSLYRSTPGLMNQQAIKNFKGSELLADILDKIDIPHRLSVPINYLTVSLRDDITSLIVDENIRWVQPISAIKSTMYLFPHGDNIICNDLDTIKNNPQFDTNVVPWLTTINSDSGTVVISFNGKAHESNLTILKSLFPDFKVVNLTKDGVLNALDSLATSHSYPSDTEKLAKDIMGDAEHAHLIVCGVDDEILEVGKVNACNIDNLYINAGQQFLKHGRGDTVLKPEVKALLYGAQTSFY